MFWAFQPNRAIVPSLPFRFGRPEIPNAAFRAAFAVRLARIVLSGICSISPAPKVGVGIRKMTLSAASWPSKSSCEMGQPLASAVPSFRPLTTNSAWTPPSRVPLGLCLNRASRTGPSRVMNDGTTLRAPKAVATSTCGFTAGLVPPMAGWEWQPTQLSRLKRGPSPSSSGSASWNSSSPAVKRSGCNPVRPSSILPAPAGPGRTPGSLAKNWALAPTATNRTETTMTTSALSLVMSALP